MVTRRAEDGIKRTVGKERLRARERSRLERAEKRARKEQDRVDLSHLAAAKKRHTTTQMKALEAAAAKGELPLAYFLRVMRDRELPDERRDWAAAQAAPYLHPRLASTELSSDPDRPLSLEPEQQLGLVRQIAFALALGARLQRESERVVHEVKKSPTTLARSPQHGNRR